MQIKSVAVFCGSSEGKDSKYCKLAAEFGKRCAELKLKLYYGGSFLGMMGAASNACRDNGGEVLGIAPDFFSKGEVLDVSLNDNLLLVKSMSERKQLMEEYADAFVILPGSYGTMDEFFEVLTDAQLGLHRKPIAILNAFGYYNDLLSQLKHFNEEGFLRDFHYHLLIEAENVDILFDKISSYQNSNDSHWLDKIKK